MLVRFYRASLTSRSCNTDDTNLFSFSEKIVWFSIIFAEGIINNNIIKSLRFTLTSCVTKAYQERENGSEKKKKNIILRVE